MFSWSKEAWKLKDGRKFGVCTSVEHWRQLLADAGFLEVSTVTCVPLSPVDSVRQGLHQLVCVLSPQARITGASCWPTLASWRSRLSHVSHHLWLTAKLAAAAAAPAMCADTAMHYALGHQRLHMAPGCLQCPGWLRGSLEYCTCLTHLQRALLLHSQCCYRTTTTVPNMSAACRSYDSAFFVWRKVAPEPAKAVLLEGISYDAPTEKIDAWIKSYIAALDKADPETEDGEPGEQTNKTSMAVCSLQLARAVVRPACSANVAEP